MERAHLNVPRRDLKVSKEEQLLRNINQLCQKVHFDCDSTLDYC